MKSNSSYPVVFYTISCVGLAISIVELFLDSSTARAYEVIASIVFSLLVAFGLPKTLPNASSVSNMYKIVTTVLALFLFVSLISQIVLSFLFTRMSDDIDVGVMHLSQNGIRILSLCTIPLCASAVAFFTFKEEKRCQIC